MWICTVRPLHRIVLAIAVLVGGFYVAGALKAQKSEIISVSSAIFASALLIPNPQIEDVYLYLVFPSGEAANPFDEGLAHYVEHLAWLSAFGGSNNNHERHSNAWTNQFSTGYWQIADGDDLRNALGRLIAVSEPLSVNSDFALQERSIVLREYDYRVAERLLYPVYRDMDKILYGDGTLARSVIGEPSVIARYSLDDAKNLHRQSHILRSATLLVYGNVDKSQLEAALSALPIEQRPKPIMNSTSNGWVEDGLIKDKTSLSISELNEDTFLYRKLVPLSICNSPAYCETVREISEDALNSALLGGLAGPLEFDQFVTRDFSLDINLIKDAYVEISFTAHPDSNISLEEVELAFQDSYRTTLQNGLTPKTFERIKSRLSGELDSILTRDRPRYIRDLTLDQLMSAQPVFSLSDKTGTLESIQLEDVNQFLRSLLANGREVTRFVMAER
ncbi:M16 family metallopeptidase [Solemya velesiana gill symbiont]|uniref:Peptidase M16 N-terminal domain-containing protein n=1 Tax=Solemya velesiana gill symbiont TaxID=1918948 RepID=A0A1T2KRX2_9GAMM|nr:insulinase family protein [Solemya velesiana gill symbiont]OOZ35619.1 hypothetical protein BOW51_11225 [Solemya velesiana gill symbiont]